jgi:hypothetical protein
MGIPIRFATPGVPLGAPRSAKQRFFAHSFFAWAGVRPLQAQHTEAEHASISRYAQNRKALVEVGVAEGASAIALAESMAPEGRLYLIDPFHLSRYPMLNFIRRTAHRAVHRTRRRGITWIERLSCEAGREWSEPIDFLFIDGDHQEEAVEEEWKMWSPHVVADGVVAFHDAREFSGGWTTCDDGPVRFVNRTFRSKGPTDWMILDEVDSLVFACRRLSLHPQAQGLPFLTPRCEPTP